ncbi:MAG TPA: lipid II flippase MurJ [Ornithinibacter sp.]|nr:lipid II flippase MurJ [Ornithinibacter sp.]
MTTEPPSPPPGDGTADAEMPEDQRLRDAATSGAGGRHRRERRQSVGRAGAVMASGTFVSRVVGLVRAALLTGVIGTTGYAADAFTTANTLPNQFYVLIAGGMLNAILVPQIVRAKLRPDGDEFVNRIITLSLAVLAVATVVLTIGAPLLVRIYYNVDDPQALQLATVFAVVCLPQIFFYGLYTILGQVLNAHGRFAGYMWAPALANIVAVIGLVWFKQAGYPLQAPPGDWTPEMVAVLAGTATLSIVIQALSLLVPLRRIGFRYRPVWGVRGHGLGEVSQVAKWTFASIVVSQLGYVVTSNVLTRATRLGVADGVPAAGIAAFAPALLIVMLPHGLVTVSLVTALYTRLSEAASHGDHAEVMRYHDQGLRLPSIILVPGIVLIGVLAPYVASTFFFSNSLEETRAIAVVLAGLVWMVIPMAWTYLNDRVFYAHQMTWMSFRLQCVTTGVATVGALLAATLAPQVTAFALGLGQTVAYVVAAAVGFWVLRRQHGHLGLRGTSLVYLKLAVPAVVTALALSWVIGTLWPDLGETRGLPGLVAGGLVLAGAGLVQLSVTWGVASALGVREVGAVLDPVRRRVRRR